MRDKEFRPILDGDWEGIKSKSVFFTDEEVNKSEIFWNYYISEPFPSQWPPSKNISLIYYIYGEGQNLSDAFHDSLLISAPWAKIEYDFHNNSILNKEILCEKLSIIGTQGIRPMNGHEVGIFDHAISIGKYLLTEEDQRSAKHLKNYYCLWIKYHSILIKEIFPNHKDFFTWLSCK